MSGTRWLAAVALVAAAAATGCASPGAPPGGPPDHAPPVILSVTPDSGATLVKAKAVTVRFNEVVSERARTGDLSTAVVLSPSDGAARVEWHRNAITVRPRKGFRANTAYSLTLLAGIADLTGNAIKTNRTFVFSTGPSIPQAAVRGAVFDWTTLKPATGALVDAQVGADTTFKWVARTDTSGRYTLPFLPSGTFIIRTIIDANNNGRLEPREFWDSVTVSVTDSLRLDLYAFGHDTLGARIVGADPKDSVTLRLAFDRPLALTPVLRPEQIELRRADSSRVRVRFVGRAWQYDSLTREREAAAKDSALKADTSAAGKAARLKMDSLRVIAERDSIERARVEARRAARDTVKRVPPPVPLRQAITPDYVAILEDPIAPGTYRITVRDAVSASLVKRTSERSFTRAKPAEKKKDDASADDAKKPAERGKPATASKAPAAKPPADSSKVPPAPIKPAAPVTPPTAPQRPQPPLDA